MAGGGERARLGRARKAFHGRKVGWRDLFVWALPGSLLPLCLVALGFSELTYGYTQSNRGGLPWFALAAVASIPFAALSLRRFSSARKRIIVHANGLSIRHIRAAPTLLLWDQILSVRTGGTRQHFFGLTTGERFIVAIKPEGGAEFHLSGSSASLQELASRIKRNIYPRLLPEMTARLENGSSLSFGQLALSRNGLQVRGESIAWPRLRSIRIERGVMSIEADGLRSIRLPASEIPNQDLALQIAAQWSTPGRS